SASHSGADWSAVQGGLAEQLVKATRMAHKTGASAAALQSASKVTPVTQFIQRLTWKHYASGAVTLVVACAVLLFGGGKRNATSPTTNQSNSAIAIQPTPAP